MMTAQEIFERTAKEFTSATEDREFQIILQGFQKVVDMDPEHIQGWRLLGETHAILGNTIQALKAFQHISLLDETQIPWTGIGDMLMQNKQYTAALEAFDKALLDNLNDNNALIGKAIAAFKSGDTVLSKTCFDEAEAVALQHDSAAALEVQALRIAIMNTNTENNA